MKPHVLHRLSLAPPPKKKTAEHIHLLFFYILHSHAVNEVSWTEAQLFRVFVFTAK